LKPRIEVHLEASHMRSALASDVAVGLTSCPKELPPKWFYDETGSNLFDAITRLPEYYPTRRERQILRRRAVDIAVLSGANTVVELGSGTSEKTRLLLDAFAEAGQLARFVPFDVDETTLRRAAEAIAAEYPQATVHAVVGDFEHHLGTLPDEGRRLVAFLGGTIGNLTPKQRAQFLGDLSSGLHPGDSLLLGTDLIKDVARMRAAYDDSQGVTAEFNRNVLRVINRELSADFVPERFAHVAVFDPEQEWMAISLRATAAHAVTVSGIDLTVDFEENELMRTEISAKFRRAGIESELAAAGLALNRWWTDPGGDFALSLSFKE